MAQNTKFSLIYLLPVNHANFHNGHVKVSIASSNGVQLTELCEVNNEQCVTPAIFKVVPRQVEYNLSANDTSYFLISKTIQKLNVTNADVDVKIHNNNKLVKTLSRTTLPQLFDATYISHKFTPHIENNNKEVCNLNHVEIYPLMHYMSNQSYVKGDVIISTHCISRPDMTNTKKNIAKAKNILEPQKLVTQEKKLNNLI